MGYNKKLVSDINEEIKSGMNASTQPDELVAFGIAVQRAMRGVKLKKRDGASTWVYREDDMYAMGWIGYGDFYTTRYGPKKFVVYSRKIENKKYSSGSKQHYMRMSNRMDIAVKAARQKLSSYTIPEIAVLHADMIRHELYRLSSSASDRLRNAYEALGLNRYSKHKSSILQELVHLAEVGHVFLNADIKPKMEELIAAQKVDIKDDEVVPVDFINVRERFGRQYVDKVRLENVNTFSATVVEEECEMWEENSVPEDVQRKVAVLYACQPRQFVEGVGYKYNDTMFYIYA